MAQGAQKPGTDQAEVEVRNIVNSLAVGLLLRLKRQTQEASGEVFSAQLLGWKVGHFLVLDNPTHSGHFVNLVAGEEFGITFLHQGAAHGFRSRLIRIQGHPTPIVFFTFPEKIESQVFRTSRRVPMRLESRVSYKGADGKPGLTEGAIIDLSLGGCQLVVKDTIPIGSELTLTFELPGGSSIEGLAAAVRREGNMGDEYVLGLQFFLKKDETERKLRSFAQMLEQMGG